VISLISLKHSISELLRIF